MFDRIEQGMWWDKSWNPVRLKAGYGFGCTKVSTGCDNCWAERYSRRFYKTPPYDGRKREFMLNEKVLTEPLKARKPRVYFVCDLMDLFHKDVPDEFIDRVVAVMGLCKQHIFVVLTKRAARMAAYMTSCGRYGFINESAHQLVGDSGFALLPTQSHGMVPGGLPFSNIWLGVSVEGQETADERIPILLQVPVAVRLVSIEPMLGAVDLEPYFESVEEPAGPLEGKLVYDGLNWVICGGETGPGARPMNPEWARAVKDQCVAAGVPFFLKQWGEYKLNVEGLLYPRTCFVDNSGFTRVGKKQAGRLLDGREWNQVPTTEDYVYEARTDYPELG